MLSGKDKKNNKQFLSICTLFSVGMLVLSGFFGLLALIMTSPVASAIDDGMPLSRSNTIISTDTTWNITSSPYNFSGNVLVNNGVTLTIDPGVVVKFGSDNYMQVEGKLIAEGTANNMITFTSNKTGPIENDYWESIKILNNANNGSSIKYCDVKYAKNGIIVWINPSGAVPNITNSNIYNGGINIQIRNSEPPSGNNISNIFAFNKISGLLKLDVEKANILIKNNEINQRLDIKNKNGNILIIDNIIYNGIYGEINKGHLNITNNSISSSKSHGIRFEQSSYINISINHNLIFGNKQSGFSWDVFAFDEFDTISIINNTIIYNDRGIDLIGQTYKLNIKHNAINNNNYGIRVLNKPNNYSINSNNIFNNSQYDVKNMASKTSGDWNFKSNWWGTTNAVTIDNKIYDDDEDFNLGKILYDPFLTSKVNILKPYNLPPIADAGRDQNVFVDETVFFDASNSYDPNNVIVSGKWDFGDGNSSNWWPNSSYHIYTKSGNYTATLTIFDGLLYNTDTCFVNVINRPPIANAGGNQNVSVNQTVLFDGSGSYDPENETLRYEWNFGDGKITSWQNSSNTSHSYSKVGMYVVGLTVSDGLLTDIDYCAVNVSATGGNKYLIFRPFITTITLNEDSAPMDNVIDLWDYVEDKLVPKDLLNFTIIGNSNPKCGAILDSNRFIDIEPAVNWYGNSIVTIQVSDGHITATQNLTIIVKPVNDPPIANAGPDKNITMNQTIYFDGSGSYDIESEYLTYKWDFDDEDSTEWLNNSDTSHSFTKLGIYTVTLTVREVTHPPQLMDNDTCIIRVLDSTINHPPIAYAGADQNITVGQLVTLDGSSSYDPDGDTITYEWTSSLKGKLGTDRSIKNIELKEGIHTITLKVSDGELSDTDTCKIRVSDISGNLPPVAEIKAIKTVQVGETVHLSGSDSYDEDGNITQYSWDFGDGIKESRNESTINHIWKQFGSYKITLMVTDNDGATGIASINILVTKSFNNDTDGDGLPNTWELKFGLDPSNPLDAELDSDGDTLTNLEEYYLGTDPTNFDSDRDGVTDNVDAFPTDPAASLDSDADNYPDDWNPGKSEKDSTTGLKLDAYPNDPKRHSKVTTDYNYQFLLILIIIVIIILLVLASIKLFVIRPKRQREAIISHDDEMLDKVKHHILEGEPISEMEYSYDEIEVILENKLKAGQISEHTYKLIKSEILCSDEKGYGQTIDSTLIGKE